MGRQMPNAGRRSGSSRRRVACRIAAALLLVAVLFLVLRHPTVTFAGDTKPSPLHARCSSVLNTAVGTRGTITSIGDGGGETWRYTYQIETNNSYTVSAESKTLAEVDCGRARGRDAVLSAVLMSPIVLLLWFVVLGYRDLQVLEALPQQIRALRGRLDD